MLFKILALAAIIILVRNTYKSWVLLQSLQNKANTKKKNQSEDEAIDAEYKVVDD
tara:strand:+ start:2051 stop:2215 length:165 start_codon:yes stop_codon:yes gene_type:complete